MNRYAIAKGDKAIHSPQDFIGEFLGEVEKSGLHYELDDESQSITLYKTVARHRCSVRSGIHEIVASSNHAARVAQIEYSIDRKLIEMILQSGREGGAQSAVILPGPTRNPIHP